VRKSFCDHFGKRKLEIAKKREKEKEEEKKMGRLNG